MTDVQVKIELGHRAAPRAKPTKENFTHDWTVYVRGPEQYNIAHFVEKVVFHLHPSFDNPKRVCKEPPYHVSEQGYAGFELPIEIYFKNKAEPRKIKLTYNLFLHLEEPVAHSRCEKLTFQNPTEEFKKKLLKAGGVLMHPAEEAQFQNLFGPPIKTTESPKKQKPSPTPSKERPSRLSLDENGKNSNGKSKDKDILTKSTSLTAAANTFGRSESARRDESHGNKEKHSKERHLSKDSASATKQADSPVPNPFSTSKRLSESPHRNEMSSKKLKRSSSFSDKKSKDKDRETEKEKDRLKENEKELEKDKECDREKNKDREREKDKQREREKEKEQEKEKIRLKEYEREKKEREKLKEIEREKERLKEKQRQKEKTDHNTEKQKDKSHKNSHCHRKHVHNDKDNEKDNSSMEKLKELKKNRSSSIDSNYKNKSNIIVDEKQKQARDNKSYSPPDLPSSDNHKRSSVKHEKSNHKEKSHKEKRHIKVEKTSLKEVKQEEKMGENKTICEPEIKIEPSVQSDKIKKNVSSTSIHKHKPLSKITSRELIDDLSLSDSSDSSSVSSLTSSSSTSGSDSDSNSDDHKSNSPKSHDSSSKASTPVTKSALGTLIAELDEDDSDEEIAAPSSMFSNHSMSSKPSPNKNDNKLFAAEPKYQPSPRKSELKRSSPEIRQDINEESKLSQNCPRAVVNSSPKSKSKGSTSERTPVKNETVTVKSERHVSSTEYFEDADKCESNGLREDTTGIGVGDEPPEELNESGNEYLHELLALQKKLMSITDPNILVKVVLLIRDLGKYEIGESTFDFDLSSLDRETIQQIQTFISEN